MKIVNKIKFFRMISLIVFAIIISCLYFTNTSFSKGDIKTKVLYVSSGDTLWNIAKQEKEDNEYYNDKDIREIIYELKRINNLDNNNLSVGQKIIVNYI